MNLFRPHLAFPAKFDVFEKQLFGDTSVSPVGNARTIFFDDLEQILPGLLKKVYVRRIGDIRRNNGRVHDHRPVSYELPALDESVYGLLYQLAAFDADSFAKLGEERIVFYEALGRLEVEIAGGLQRHVVAELRKQLGVGKVFHVLDHQKKNHGLDFLGGASDRTVERSHLRI